MTIDFQQTPFVEDFKALIPHPTVYTIKPSIVRNILRLYLPKQLVEHKSLSKGDVIYIAFDETRDYIFLEKPDKFFPYIKSVKIQAANFNTLFIYVPKKLINRYKNNLNKAVLTETYPNEFSLLFYTS